MSMIDPETLQGKRIAMLTWGKKDNGEDDVHVISGIAAWDGSELKMYGIPGINFYTVKAEWLDRIRPVEDKLKSVFQDAEYAFTVSIAPLPDGADTSGMVNTGLRLPPDNDK